MNKTSFKKTPQSYAYSHNPDPNFGPNGLRFILYKMEISSQRWAKHPYKINTMNQLVT